MDATNDGSSSSSSSTHQLTNNEGSSSSKVKQPLTDVTDNSHPLSSASSSSTAATKNDKMANHSTSHSSATPTAAAAAATASSPCLFAENIDLLGVRFLTKSPQVSFEADVQATMKSLVARERQKKNLATTITDSQEIEGKDATPNTTTSFELPSVLLRIPSALAGDLEIVLEKAADVARVERDHQEAAAAEEGGKGDQLQRYLSGLLSAHSINIPANQIFVYRGPLNSAEERCLAFTTQITLPVPSAADHPDEDGKTAPPAPATTTTTTCYYQCVILYAESPAKVTDIIDCFKRLFTEKTTTTATTTSATPPSKVSGSAHSPAKSASPTGLVPTTTITSTAAAVTTTSSSSAEPHKVVMIAGVEIQEEVSEGKWSTAPLDKEGFKLRSSVDKRIVITLHQETLVAKCYPVIKVERCFGMLLGPGRHQASSAMVAIGLHSMRTSSIVGALQQPALQWTIVASWIPSELKNFDYLNTETARDSRVYFTIAVDLVVEAIDEPVRFIIEAKAKIVAPPPAVLGGTSVLQATTAVASATEKFWSNFAPLSKGGGGGGSSRQLQETFNLMIREKAFGVEGGGEENSPSSFKYEVVSCYSSTQIAHQKQRLSLQLNRAKMSGDAIDSAVSTVDTPSLPEVPEDDDEPLASGTGLVSQECTQAQLASWADVLDRWRANLDVRPSRLSKLVRLGVPEPLRPEVWQLLAGAHREEERLMALYRTLVKRDSPFEAVIRRDINRTFPGHEKFREPGSEGQEKLFLICKAYSNHDEEIGYCQGLSFLVAALLLHMPEEQAFCVFVRIMYDYGLRSLYRCGLEELHCKFYQLERLLDDHLPELYMHFLDLNIETHMYASQWFLTLFTTKFPLPAVFIIIDLFLLDSMDTLLQLALALLKNAKSDLLALDFEGVMKYFRVTMPKRYIADEAARQLIRTAVKIDVRKKAKKYGEHYRIWAEQRRIQQNPLEHLEAENKRLIATSIRLEQENDDLSAELLATCKSKIRLQSMLETAEGKADTLNGQLMHTHAALVEAEEEKARLAEEVAGLKEMCRKEIERSERESKKDRTIIEEYKSICRNHQCQLEREKERFAGQLTAITEAVGGCSACSAAVTELLDPSANGNGGPSSPTSLNSNSLDGGGGGEEGTAAAAAAASNGTGGGGKYRDSLLTRIADLEAELIKTKMALAEAEDRNGLLAGKLHSTSSELNLMKAAADEAAAQRSNTWLTKTLSTIRDATSSSSNSNSNSSNSSSSSGKTSSVRTSNSISGGIYAQGSLQENNSSGGLPQQSQQPQQHQQPSRRFSSRDIFHHQQQ